jgi:hypothetical protein
VSIPGRIRAVPSFIVIAYSSSVADRRTGCSTGLTGTSTWNGSNTADSLRRRPAAVPPIGRAKRSRLNEHTNAAPPRLYRKLSRRVICQGSTASS